MKRLISLVMLTLLLCGCQSNQPLVTKTTVKERLVPVALPTYFGSVKLWLKCDSLGQVVTIKTEASGDFQTAIEQDSNAIQIRFKTKHDTVYLPVRDSIIENTIVVGIPAKTTWWHMALMALGILLCILFFIKIKTII